MKKISLISLMSAMFVAPAMATPSHTSDTFPANELMQEDYTYQNQATYTNMGVYSGTVTANAEYEWTPITVTAGNYLPQSSTSTSQCTAGNFCSGLGESVHYDDTQSQGLTSCSTLENGAYPNSASGSTANTDCYRACSVENMGNNGSITTIAHATALTGNDYYNDTANDTCVASACESGWSLGTGANAGTCVANTITITWNGASAADIAANEAGSCTYGGDIRTPRAATPVTGKTFVGWRFEKPVFDLSTLTNTYPYGDGYLDYYGEGSYNSEDYGLTNNMWGLEFQDEYDEEHDTTPSWKVRGEARCSDTNDGQYNLYDAYYGNSGNGVSISANPGNATTGKYCWFRTTGYQAFGDSTWQEVTSNPWVFMADYDDAEDCRQQCAMYVSTITEHAMGVDFLFGKPNNND